ncbi:AfsR/SARP family transcriptional regulator [Streptomyces sp. H34-S4]|uniref:AfsR/SARP family transcriptional regulator n=1 Tax=Streptomyces sp. H34-S4 TaxID=2996463 RepID=UPI00227168C6|nr:AfsR/SARP family transcriptional regulator [Streptomyces sp. H34-S4]MCY0934582.1 AfsR/SARP family transcriptional regulator [Streptomyces sp. H34-S4]
MSGVLLRERGFKGGDGSTSRLRFRLLGPLQTNRGTKALELGPPKQRALLAVLLLRPGLETGVDQLIEALWGEDYPAYAKNLIQKSVSGLRGLLSADEGGGRGVFLEWSSGGYRMDIGDSEVDLYEYERLAAAGIAAARKGEILRAVGLLEEARVMSTGPLVEGLEGPMLERERLYRQERFLADMEVRAELELELGRHRNAVPYLYYAVDKYPLRERFLWLLMLALYRSDRGNEALTVYSDQRARVVQELGVEPGSALRALHARLLLQDPQLMVMSALRQDSGAAEDAFVPTPRLPLARRGPFG